MAAAGKEEKGASGLLSEAAEGRTAGGEGGSWIPRTFQAVLGSSSLRLSAGEAREAVTVVALERYAAEAPPPGLRSSCSWQRAPAAPGPAYRYDVTVWDGAFAERCQLSPELHSLVHRNALRCGARLRVTQCSYLYHEKKLRYGFLCLQKLELLRGGEEGGCPGPPPPPGPEAPKEFSQKPPGPLGASRRHYLPLWNNEEPCGEAWAQKEPGPEASVPESKLTSLLHLEMNWRIKLHFQPLLVRIMHKSRLRYYGKPETKEEMPYQAYFEVADHSGMASMVLWNALCPEWYNSMKIGTVLLLEQYAVKASYPFKTQPAPGDLHMKRFSSIEISLNVRDPPSKINIIPEHKVKAEWKLPEVKYQFITRSELDDLPNNHFCDIIGLVQYVGRTERTRKRDPGEDFWICRWVRVLDGTSEQPFILQLFATSQPEIFEQIHPMTYLVSTQMRVVRDTAENKSGPVYLTTSNESQMFITGWHKGQPYTKDAKVKSFIQWINTQKEASHMERMSMGGYCSFPPAPDTFVKYCKNIKVESVLTKISEVEKEIEGLHYREHKRIACQGIISALRYVSSSNTPQEASEVEPTQIIRGSSLQTFVTENERNVHLEEGSQRYPQTGEAASVQRSPSVEQQDMETRKGRAKRRTAAVETRDPSPAYFTRSAKKKRMLDELLKQNLLSENESQEVEEATQASESVNHDVAIDVAFLPLSCPEDARVFPTEAGPSRAESPPSEAPCPQETLHTEGHPERASPSDEVVKAAADLEKQHVICILDICSLGENKVEVFLKKVYKITEADIANQT